MGDATSDSVSEGEFKSNGGLPVLINSIGGRLVERRCGIISGTGLFGTVLP